MSINFSAYMLILFFSVFIHEMGHTASIRINRLKILSVEILPFGINIITNDNRLTAYKTDIIIALSGPCVNIIFAIFTLVIIKFNGYNSYLFFAFLTNILYAGINLFPVKSLDGGKIAEILVKILFSENISHIIFSCISAVFLGVLSILALFILMVTGYNFTLILLCCYLFYTIHFSPKFLC